MESKDLRIGNWVYMEKGIVLTRQVSLDLILNDGRGYNLNPIPLTEDWLLRFGLIKFSTNENEVAFRLSEGSRYYVEMRKEWTVDDYGNNLQIEIKSVHQLMNLYHSLTGKELTI